MTLQTNLKGRLVIVEEVWLIYLSLVPLICLRRMSSPLSVLKKTRRAPLQGPATDQRYVSHPGVTLLWNQQARWGRSLSLSLCLAVTDHTRLSGGIFWEVRSHEFWKFEFHISALGKNLLEGGDYQEIIKIITQNACISCRKGPVAGDGERCVCAGMKLFVFVIRVSGWSGRWEVRSCSLSRCDFHLKVKRPIKERYFVRRHVQTLEVWLHTSAVNGDKRWCHRTRRSGLLAL